MAPYLVPKARQGYRMGDGVLQDEMILDGLQCAMNDIHMGITAENVAEKYGITREMQDQIATRASEGRRGHRGRQVQGRDRARWSSRRGRATRWSSTPTSTSAAETTLEGSGQTEARPSRRTAPSPPATPPASTTPPPPSWSPPGSGPRRRASSPWPPSWPTPPPRLDPGLHGHGPLLRHQEGPGQDRHDARPDGRHRGQRGLRRPGRRRGAGAGPRHDQDQPLRRRHRPRPPHRRLGRPYPHHPHLRAASRRAARTVWPPCASAAARGRDLVRREQ